MRMGLVTAILLMTAVLLLGPAGPGVAGERAAGHRGGHGAIQGRTGGHQGLRGSGVAPHRRFVQGHFRGHSGVRTRVFIGSGFWWGAPWWWGGPAYPYYAYPPAVVQEAPPVYTQQAPEPPPPAYWYYCQDPQGYHPYIKECPGGWLTVVPPSNAPPQAQ